MTRRVCESATGCPYQVEHHQAQDVTTNGSPAEVIADAIARGTLGGKAQAKASELFPRGLALALPWCGESTLARLETQPGAIRREFRLAA